MSYARNGKRQTAGFCVNKSPQAGSPLTAGDVFELSTLTESLSVALTRNMHHYYFPQPPIAPTAVVTAIDTNTRFSTDNTAAATGDFMIPMRLQANHSAIGVWVTMAYEASQRARVKLRVNSETLVDSVATVNGDLRTINTGGGSAVGIGRWANDLYGGHWLRTNAMLRIEPTVPSNRRIALTFDARLENETGSDWAVTNAERLIKFMALKIWSYGEAPAPIEG